MHYIKAIVIIVFLKFYQHVNLNELQKFKNYIVLNFKSYLGGLQFDSFKAFQVVLLTIIICSK